MRNRFLRQGRPLHCRLPILPTFLYEGEGTGGGGSTTPPAPASNKPSAADVLEQYGGSAVRMAERVSILLGENYDYREKARNHEREMSDLKAKLPAEGSVVISKADAELLEKYRKFGTPEVLSTELETGKAAKTRVAADEKSKTDARAAKAEGLKPGAFKLIAKGLPVSVREVDAQNKEGNAIKVDRAFVTVKNGDKDEEQALHTYLKANLDEDEYQALLDDGSSNGTGSQNNGNGNGSGGGFQYPGQSGGTGNQNKEPESYAGGLYTQHNAPQASSK